MAGRGRASAAKRQKERSRQERQREKMERKQQRKLEKSLQTPTDGIDWNAKAEDFVPVDTDSEEG
jgi:hypothetical protein